MTDDPNEIVAAARAAAQASEAAAAHKAQRAPARHWRLGQIGLGVGIGSAAVAAAVLFARRDRD